MTDTGGSAFPRLGLKVMEPNGTIVPHEPGLTVRDYFAAKAMQTLIGGKTPYQLLEGGYMATAMSAYAMADAMLKARQE